MCSLPDTCELGLQIPKKVAVLCLPSRLFQDKISVSLSIELTIKVSFNEEKENGPTVVVHWLVILISSSAFKHSDFVLVCQQQGDIIFVISIMDSCVSESSGQMVLLPVVVPVSILVCTESKQTDLGQTKNKSTVSHSKTSSTQALYTSVDFVQFSHHFRCTYF